MGNYRAKMAAVKMALGDYRAVGSSRMGVRVRLAAVP